MDTLKLYQGHPHENGRHCTSCGVFKTADQFHLERDSKAKNGITMRGQCRPCREHIKWKSFIVRTYGITVDDYYVMLEKQNYRCAICDSESNKNAAREKMFIDHCHETGKVRGLLCSKCNIALGNFDDDIKTLKRAISYLSSSERNF
jgi:hypothetical protein